MKPGSGREKETKKDSRPNRVCLSNVFKMRASMPKLIGLTLSYGAYPIRESLPPTVLTRVCAASLPGCC